MIFPCRLSASDLQAPALPLPPSLSLEFLRQQQRYSPYWWVFFPARSPSVAPRLIDLWIIIIAALTSYVPA